MNITLPSVEFSLDLNDPATIAMLVAGGAKAYAALACIVCGLIHRIADSPLASSTYWKTQGGVDDIRFARIVLSVAWPIYLTWLVGWYATKFTAYWPCAWLFRICKGKDK